MESVTVIPACPPPWDAPNDVLPMLVVLFLFLAGSWLLRRWKKRRGLRQPNPAEPEPNAEIRTE